MHAPGQHPPERAGFAGAPSVNHVRMGYTKTNLRSDVEDQAPKFDMPSEMQARFARGSVGGETLGLSLFTLAPNFRIPFGHKHANQEEVYVVVRGSGRVKVEDEIVDLAAWDAIRFGVNTMRCMEAGPDGIEYVAFGAGDDPRDAEMAPNWWSD
jgi:mannose-6-phosphate isomerase-like protein (cupin superfamily)